MLLTAYRLEIQALLTGTHALRKPFLRRSLRPDALLVTDLPRITDAGTLAVFSAALTARGWTVLRCGELLELTPRLTPPAMAGEISPGPDRTALRRLHSLLARHPDTGDAFAQTLAFLKAEEAGPQPLENLCRSLCRQCAACLRAHTPLPGTLLPYVHYALAEEGKT